MRKIMIALIASFGMGLFDMPESLGAPVNGAAILELSQDALPVGQARLYCANRYTGRFLYWGRCGGYRRPYYGYRRPYYGYRPVYRYRPRYNCINRYTGRILYRGRCRY